MSLIRKIKKKLFPQKKEDQKYIELLKIKGVDIGEKCRIWSPSETFIDLQRPHMLHIGNYVKITRGVTILCHDFSRSVFCNMSGYENVGEAKETYIGDNVFIGMNAIILMGAHIGKNSIVAAGAVVSGHFEDNQVIGGNPAKVICSLDEFNNKKKAEELHAAKLFALKFLKTYGRDPNIDEMTDSFSWMYLPRTENVIKQYPSFFRPGGVSKKTYIDNFLNSKPIFNSYDEFIQYCKKDR